jgi:hypothetical protein
LKVVSRDKYLQGKPSTSLVDSFIILGSWVIFLFA